MGCCITGEEGGEGGVGGRRVRAEPFGRHVRRGLWPSLPARMVHEVFRTEELSERRRAHSVDHARFEVKETPMPLSSHSTF